MTALRAVYTRPDGGISVVGPAPESRLAGEAELAWVQRVADLVVPQGLSYRIVDTAALPLPSRRWRNAWHDPGAGGVAVSLPAARLLRRAELLARRAVVLALTTEALERAVDDGAAIQAAALRAKRRRLRDVEATLDADLPGLATLQALDEYLPADLA